VQSGLLGLLSCTGLMYAIWMFLGRSALSSKDPLTIATCACWSTWVLSGTFNWTNPIYAVIVMPVLAAVTTPVAAKGCPENQISAAPISNLLIARVADARESS
jgi:hypothetical protein